MHRPPVVAAVRPVRASDKGPLMDFVKDVWGGHDYIPLVWDSWLRDRSGQMFVAEVDGVPRGMNRVKFLEDGSAWFEGARVHPDYRGRGLASLLGERSMDFARGRGAAVFRLTSSSRNRAAHRQIAKMEFDEIARFSVYVPPGRTEGRRAQAKRFGPGEEGGALNMISRTLEFALGAGVFWHEFAAAALTPDVVSKLVAEKAAWHLGEAVAVARRGNEGPRMWEEICFLGGPPREAVELVLSLLGRERSASERWVFLPQGSPIIPEARRRGFARDLALILFERRAANG